MNRIAFIISILLLHFNLLSQNISEGFEGAFPPVGWNILQSDCGDQVYWWQTDGEYDICTGNYSALILGSDVICGKAKDWLVTPQLAPTSTNSTFTFTMHQSYVEEHGSIYTLRVSTNSATDTLDFVIVNTWNESQMPTNCTVTNIDMSAYVGDSIYIAFVMENDAGDNWIIDDVNGLPMVGKCYPPTGLETFDVISTSAGLIWESLDTVPNYFWEVVPKGNDEGIGVVVSDYVNDTFDTATNLQLSTDYDYRVRSLCSSGDTSYYSTPFSFTTLGAPPSNDECLDAIALSINADDNCTDIYSGNNLNATKSMDGCIGTSNDDVWFSFVPTAEKHEIQISNITAVKGSSIDIVHEIFEGDCNSLVSILCNDDNISTISSLTIGNTYYLRIYSKYTTSNQSFDVCIKTPPVAPENDECVGAVSLIVNGDETCTDFVSGTTVGATESLAGCIGTADDDVWYSFVATSVKHSFELTNVLAVVGNNTDMVHEIFKGNCNNLESIKCSDNNKSAVTGLVIDQTYFVRIYSKYSTSRQSFDFCVKTPPTPPINDICDTALGMTVGENGTCQANKVTCSTTNATNTLYGSCDGSGEDPDLWYSFTVPLNGDYSFESILGQPGITLYTGSCSDLTEIACINNTDGILKNLLINTTYYARIYTDYPEDNVEFCIEKDLSPDNNYCEGAKLLSIGQGYCESLEIGSNQYASNSEELPDPNCGNYSGGDIWYKFVVPTSGNVEIEMSRIGNFIDGAMAVYSGSCGNLNLVSCNDDSNDNPNTSYMPKISLTGQNPEDTLYLRIWEYDNDVKGKFSICIWEPSDLIISTGGDCVQGSLTIVNSTNGNIYTWVPLEDMSGNIIAFVYPNGNELGNITPTVFTRSELPLRIDDDGTQYINRDIEIIVQNQPTGNNPIVRLIYTQNELNDLINESSSVNVVNDMNMTKTELPCSGEFQGQGSLFSQEDNQSVNSAGGRFLEFQIPGFSTFYVHGGNAALPLSFVKLFGSAKEGGNEITWGIETTIEVDRIILLKSDDNNEHWQEIYELKDSIETNGKYFDSIPYHKSYYKLKILDLDGGVYYSKIVEVINESIVNEQLLISIYPNPSSGEINLLLSNYEIGDILLKVYDVNSSLVYIDNKKQIKANEQQPLFINLSALKEGVYFVNLISKNSSIVKRIVINK